MSPLVIKAEGLPFSLYENPEIMEYSKLCPGPNIIFNETNFEEKVYDAKEVEQEIKKRYNFDVEIKNFCCVSLDSSQFVWVSRSLQ
ncbi:hypothetical protein SCHPADRAFT_264175 [Schizopora paradoxa]|uniref:Uncharacterized protein n=1 Tax=Schizopora paradoxa TaxID=27342 RepID=A0A0H2RU12_9AGAM|nr:hypothetical protein SCHPADRAFT_264175 [Schizopora paradoxa]